MAELLLSCCCNNKVYSLEDTEEVTVVGTGAGVTTLGQLNEGGVCVEWDRIINKVEFVINKVEFVINKVA